MASLSPDIPTAGMKPEHAIVIERYQESRDSRYLYERQWYLNCSFYLGSQWVKYHTASGVLREPPRQRNEIRETINLITPMIADRIAKMLRAEALPTAIPAKDTESAKRKAFLASAFLQYMRRRANWAEVKRWLLTWLFPTGNAFMWVGWDDQAGRRFHDTFDGRDIELTEGDVFFEPDGPFGTFVDPAALTLADAQWVIRVRRVNVELLRDKWPRFAKEIQPDDYSGDYSQFFMEALKSQAANQIYWNRPAKNACTLLEYYEKRSKRYPAGRRVLMTGSGTVLADKPNPYVYLRHEFPVVHYREIYTPPRFWGGSTCDRAVPVQRSINRMYSRIAEHLNLQIYPRIAIPKGAGIAKSQFTNQPGEKVYFNGQQPPMLLQAATVSADAWRWLESKLGLFRQITGWLEITQGSVPPGVTSGVALQILAEQNAGPLVTVSKTIASCDELVAEHALAIATRRYREPRKLQIIGDAESAHEVWLDPNELRPGDIGDAFVLHMTSAMEVTETKAGREAKALELVNRKILNPEIPNEKEMLQKMLDLATTADAYTHNRLDREKADRENRMMSDGRYPAADWFDNHLIHIDCHTRFMKSREYEQLGEQEKLHFTIHTQTHYQMAGLPIPGAPPMGAAPPSMIQGAPTDQGQPLAGQPPTQQPLPDGAMAAEPVAEGVGIGEQGGGAPSPTMEA